MQDVSRLPATHAGRLWCVWDLMAKTGFAMWTDDENAVLKPAPEDAKSMPAVQNPIEDYGGEADIFFVFVLC